MERNELRELTIEEQEQVEGGIAPIILPIGLCILLSIIEKACN